MVGPRDGIASEHLIVATVRRSHGVRGELLVAIETDRPDRVFRKGRELRVGDGRGKPDGRSVTLDGVRFATGGAILKLRGVANREASDAYRGATLLIPAEEAEPAREGEVHYRDLVGLTALEGGRPLGEVTGILRVGQSELLEVRRIDGGETLVPFVKEIVRDVDLSRREVRLELPDGFLEI